MNFFEKVLRTIARPTARPRLPCAGLAPRCWRSPRLKKGQNVAPAPSPPHCRAEPSYQNRAHDREPSAFR